ncbi:D-alanine--D-alanine ligase family protein [Microbulbifer sp. JTAC008]|uniref:D-alanine--D-alanine ligase family protein n=1 Tax=Microbulbifer sp. JTAC008 TaxID=3243374 RepID=UPI00403A09C7
MRIGIVYDLRDDYLGMGFSEEDVAELDHLETIDAIHNALTSAGHHIERVGNIHRLAQQLVEGNTWDLVFNVAEGIYGTGREAQVPALLDAWKIPYTFSDPFANTVTLNKEMTKRILRDMGIPTAQFAVVRSVTDVNRVELEYPLMTKPLREGTSKGISPESKVIDKAALKNRCEYLLSRFNQPVLVETFLPGLEFTVGFLGTGATAECIGVMEKLLGDEPVYYKYDGAFPGRLVDDDQALKVRAIAQKTWEVLECRDGGRVDIRFDAQGAPMVMEVNVLPGLRPEVSELPVMCELAGIQYGAMINRIVESAISGYL